MKMYRKVLTLILCMSFITVPVSFVKAEDGYNKAREVEYLPRGGYGIAVDGGVYLSWRLLGTELIDQTFDIYRNEELIKEGFDATNYTDAEGTIDDTYKIVPHNGKGLKNDVFKPFSRDYMDIILDKPESTDEYSYVVRDVSVGDVDNDGEYEFFIKWDPSNYQDNSVDGYTGNVYIDCYKQSGKKLWRIDLGKNIRAGAHYTQFIVYDFDGDGKAEMALRTAPGSKDSNGDYVSTKGAAIEVDGKEEPFTMTDTETEEQFTDKDDLRNDKGRIVKGPDWLTMFNGETGEAMQTVNYYPQRGAVTSWGDDYGNRSERYNAGVAYLDGIHPSLFIARGYYKRAAMAAYDWKNGKFTMRWHRDDKGTGKVSELSGETHKNMNGTLYGNGDHQISVCDADNDGKDEIVFGSTVVDDDGEILNSTDHGHGDALHASDFDNDGWQEIFQVHEETIGFEHYGAEVRKAYIEGKNGNDLVITGIDAPADVGRGLMGNFDDDNGTSEFFFYAGVEADYPEYDNDKYTYNFSGKQIGDAPSNINPSFLIWWDGDLSREILNRTSISKYDAASSVRTELRSFPNMLSISKDAPGLSADLFGDWREEVCYPTNDNGTLRIFMTTYPTDYKMPTLMHDTQYRTAVAWQNVGYNQPPHPKFYVGKAALAENGKYLAPAAQFDTVEMVGPEPVISESLSSDEPMGTYTVNIKAVGDIKKTLNTYEGIEAKTSISYAFPKYIVEDGFAYEATANSGVFYGGSIANVVKNQDIEIQYKKKYSGVVYLDDIDIDTGKNADVRASNCLAQDNKSYTSDYTLKPGYTYTIVLRYDNTGRGTQFVADGKILHTITNNNSAWVDYTISDVTVEHESALSTLPGSSNTYDPLDTVLIINETKQATEPTAFDLTDLDETGMVITGASDTTSTAITLSGVKSDKGSTKHSEYVAFTAPSDGTLSLKFEASATRGGSGQPRLYYCTDSANLTKNSSQMIAEAGGANTETDVELKVNKGMTYYLFGYLYNNVSEFTYTLSDFVFTPDPITEYLVTFVNYDGTELQKKNVTVWGKPTYTGSEPKKSQDDEYTYEFIGWDKELAEVTEAATYTAQFKSAKRKYTITWSIDGQQTTEEYEYGTIPAHANPTKNEDARYTYTFDKWEPEISAVAEAKSYTAKFTSSPREYDIRFETNGGEINGIIPESYTYGTSVTLPADVILYGSTFDGWYDNSELRGTKVEAIPSTSTGDVTYYAKWNTDYLESLSGFTDKLIIKKIKDGNDIKLIISPKEGKLLPNMILYTTIYNENNTLKSVTPTEYNVSENDKTVTVTVLEPQQLAEKERYKIMLWDTNYAPIISAISRETTEFFN